jgi:hypothetical protein
MTSPQSAASDKSSWQLSDPAYPSSQEIKLWDVSVLLEWIQKNLNKPLSHENARKFLIAEIHGSAFLRHADQLEFFREAGITLGPSSDLANLAQTIVCPDDKLPGKYQPAFSRGKILHLEPLCHNNS